MQAHVDSLYTVDSSISLIATTEEDDLRDAVRSLLAGTEIEDIRRLAETPAGFSDDTWRALCTDLAVTAMSVPESDGGLGYSYSILCTVLEECGRALRPEPVLTSAAIGVHALRLGSGPSLKALTERAISGDAVIAVADIDSVPSITATPSGDSWLLTGRTVIVGSTRADAVVVVASTTDGPGLFAVDSSSWTSREALESIDPTRPTTAVTVTDSAAELVTDPAATAAALPELRDRILIGAAAENVGIAAQMLEDTIAYTTTRRQFDRQIASFQSIKHRLADMLLAVERARSATRYAEALFDDSPDRASLAAAIAAAVSIDSAIEVTTEAIQLHGGIGFTWEHKGHNYYRRALSNEATFGASASHRQRVAALVNA